MLLCVQPRAPNPRPVLYLSLGTGHQLPKPEVILQLEKGEEPWLVERGIHQETHPGEDQTARSGQESLARVVTSSPHFEGEDWVYLASVSPLLVCFLQSCHTSICIHENYLSVSVLGSSPVHIAFLIITTNLSICVLLSFIELFCYLCLSFPCSVSLPTAFDLLLCVSSAMGPHRLPLL